MREREFWVAGTSITASSEDPDSKSAEGVRLARRLPLLLEDFPFAMEERSRVEAEEKLEVKESHKKVQSRKWDKLLPTDILYILRICQTNNTRSIV